MQVDSIDIINCVYEEAGLEICRSYMGFCMTIHTIYRIFEIDLLVVLYLSNGMACVCNVKLGMGFGSQMVNAKFS